MLSCPKEHILSAVPFSTTNSEMNGAAAAVTRVRQLRVLGFLAVCLVPFVLAWDLTRTVSTLVFSNDSFSPLMIIPPVSLFLIYESRKRIFSAVLFGWVLGAALIVPGLISLFAARFNVWHLRSTNQGALLVFGIVLIWLGAFGLFFGARAFRSARFPLLFLLFSVPIPEPVLSDIIRFLQKESADAAEVFFRLAGVPCLRQDLIFRLPGVSIRVAEECSGIRSSLAILITTVLASYIFLRSTWRKLFLCAFVVPVAILKNGLRIATLSTLGIYMDPGFLYGNLHHHGGFLFFVVALMPIALLLRLLQKGENPTSAMPTGAGAQTSTISARP